MAATLQEFHTRVGSLIREKTGGHVEVDDVKESLNRGIRRLKSKHGVYASKNRTSLSLYPTVYEIPAPSDYADIIGLLNRGGTYLDFDSPDAEEFWKNVSSNMNMISDDTILGTTFLLAKHDGGQYVVAHACDAYDSNGTWAADTSTSDALNVQTYDINYKTGSASVSFDVDVSQSVNNHSVVSNSTLTAVDLSDYENKSRVFMWVYIPTVTYVTGMTLRWGSSDSAYWEASATTQYSGLALVSGWNRISFAWPSTSTGSPSSSAVDFIYFQLTYSASQADMSGVLIDDIIFAIPKVFDFDYQSTYFVRSSGGTAQTEFSATSDYSMLDDEDDDVLFYFMLQDAHLMREQFIERGIAEKQFKEAAQELIMRRGASRKRKVRSYYKMSRSQRGGR